MLIKSVFEGKEKQIIMAKLGFTWYPKDWKTNEKVFNMSLELRGFYREFIDYAYENDNRFTVEVRYFCRMMNINKRKFDTLFVRLLSISMIIKDGETYHIPSVEARMQLIRGGRNSKPTPKPTPKPNGKPTPEQREIEIESKRKGFNLFWNLYDKKIDIKKCQMKWNKLNDEEKKNIMDYIPKYHKEQPDKQYMKNPATFLNNRSWENEIVTNGKKHFKQIMK